MVKLRENSLMHTVSTSRPVKRRWSLFCNHQNITDFVWIDHRSGPGSFADTWKGTVCCDCSKIIKKEFCI